MRVFVRAPAVFAAFPDLFLAVGRSRGAAAAVHRAPPRALGPSGARARLSLAARARRLVDVVRSRGRAPHVRARAPHQILDLHRQSEMK